MKVGWFTATIGLVAFALLIILQIFSIVSGESLRLFAAAIIILFGAEILWHSSRRKEDGRQRNPYSTVSVIVVAALVVFSLLSFVAPSFQIFQPKYVAPVQGEYTVSDQIKKIRVQIPDGKIQIRGVPGMTVAYEGKLKTAAYSQARADRLVKEHWNVREKGDTLELILDLPKRNVWFDFSFFAQERPRLYLEIPQHLMVITKTSNGEIQAENLHNGVELKSSNGRIAVSDIKGDVAVKTSNGSITIKSVVSGAWDARTSNGKIALTIPEDTNAAVEARTSNGRFLGDFDWIGEGGSRKLFLGDETHRIRLITSNGNIEVNKGF